jgi:hypothetical protein
MILVTGMLNLWHSNIKTEKVQDGEQVFCNEIIPKKTKSAPANLRKKAARLFEPCSLFEENNSLSP